MSRAIYGVTALFESPNAIIHAAEKVRDSAYTDFDVNTPYPLHGMDPAMGLKPTKVPYVTIIFFMIGVFALLGFVTWVMCYDYPINIGGKPMFSLPAFVPVFWAAGVLIGMLATVALTLGYFCQLPCNNCPLHDTDYMRKVSCDGFGLVIEGTDPTFNEDEVKSFLTSIGGKDIATHYEGDDNEA